VEGDGFREQLEARIARYASQRDELQSKIVELNHALSSLDNRLDVAIQMYRLEFGVEPDAATHVRLASPALTSHARRSRDDGSSWNQVVTQVLAEAGTPLHLNDIWRRVAESGFSTAAKDPLRSLASVLVRHPGIRRTGRNIYALKTASASPQDPIDGLDVAETAPIQEGEAA
jgi:hypothetical protein